MTPEEKIAMGECVSPLTVDHCPYCIDTCQAFRNACNFSDLKHELNIPDKSGPEKE
jgi:hypothetical protein